MKANKPVVLKRLMLISIPLLIFFAGSLFLGISVGSSGWQSSEVFHSIFGTGEKDAMLHTILWKLRFPRVLMAALVGATLSLGGLSFQALLRNPLAEPYILGVSGGAAIGAIIGILLGMSRFPGITFCAFSGSILTIFLLLVMTSGQTVLRNDSLLLSGVMVNAFCSAVIMFLVSITQDSRLHNIIFWLMGDLGAADLKQVAILASLLIPCFLLFFLMSNVMNLLLMGKESAHSMGINVRVVFIGMLVVTSFMTSAAVSYCGLIGFVGLVIPHLLRILLGPDHRILVPACILGGGGYMILCDMLARSLPRQGEMPAGVVTALIGAPLFIYLLKRSNQ